jgi:hypothetical protein
VCLKAAQSEFGIEASLEVALQVGIRVDLEVDLKAGPPSARELLGVKLPALATM